MPFVNDINFKLKHETTISILKHSPFKELYYSSLHNLIHHIRLKMKFLTREMTLISMHQFDIQFYGDVQITSTNESSSGSV